MLRTLFSVHLLFSLLYPSHLCPYCVLHSLFCFYKVCNSSFFSRQPEPGSWRDWTWIPFGRFGLCSLPPCKQLLSLSCNCCQIPFPPPVTDRQKLEGRRANSCCSNQAHPRETRQGGSTSALLFSAQVGEKTVSASPQVLPAPNQAWSVTSCHALTLGCHNTYYATHNQQLYGYFYCCMIGVCMLCEVRASINISQTVSEQCFGMMGVHFT